NKALQILKNEGNFQFRDVSHDWLGGHLYRDTSSSNLYTVADLRDVNRDGALDLVLRNMGAESDLMAAGDPAGATIYLNDGTGHFTALINTINGEPVGVETLHGLLGTQYQAGFPIVFDVDNDGITDQVFIDTMSEVDRTVMPNQTTGLHIATLFGAQTSHVY